MIGALRKGGFPARFQRTASAVQKLGCCVLASSFFLGGCSSGSSAMLATARHLYNNNASPSDSHTFRPEFSYLRATFEGRTVFLVLGYVDPHPEGPTEVWYSASGETVRLRHGRLVATPASRPTGAPCALPTHLPGPPPRPPRARRQQQHASSASAT